VVIASSQTMGIAVGPSVAGYIFDASNSYKPAFLITFMVGMAGLLLPTTLRPVKDLMHSN
jgi:cyanate permease